MRVSLSYGKADSQDSWWRMDEIKIGIGVSSIGRFLPLVGKAAGLFAKENISVEVVNQQDEEQVVSDIVTQATPVGTPNAPSLIFSLLEGNDLVIVGGILNRPAFYLAANATIGGIADLMGKRVGINQPRRMAGMVMLALLRRWSLDTSDLTLVDLGINDRSLEALRAGEIDAALLPPEKAFLAATEGFRVVADSLTLELSLGAARHYSAISRRQPRAGQENRLHLYGEHPPLQESAPGDAQGDRPLASRSGKEAESAREML
jgi:ABC-type nitrate/sulfonate/bicarbonate transport system substrate-binding protein